jgi:STAS-like domain of unknown function (DUF4325)
MKIIISKDFSEFPAGRNISDGPNSGERFRVEFLEPNLKKEEIVTVNLDGTMGYGSSFLEEAFGGLVRNNQLNFETLKKKLILEDTRKIYGELIWQYIKEENSRVFGK